MRITFEEDGKRNEQLIRGEEKKLQELKTRAETEEAEHHEAIGQVRETKERLKEEQKRNEELKTRAETEAAELQEAIGQLEETRERLKEEQKRNEQLISVERLALLKLPRL